MTELQLKRAEYVEDVRQHDLQNQQKLLDAQVKREDIAARKEIADKDRDAQNKRTQWGVIGSAITGGISAATGAASKLGSAAISAGLLI